MPRSVFPAALVSGDCPRGPSIAASVLAADFSRLGQEITNVQIGGVDRLHVDIMDGHFVPNLSFGLPVVEALVPWARVPIDVHLMVTDPHTYIPALLALSVDSITFHIEAVCHPVPLLQQIKQGGAAAGLAINPGTAPGRIEPLLSITDVLCFMTVSPGFGGQAFLPWQLPILDQAADLCQRHGVILMVDGGITPLYAAKAAVRRATIVVAGSSIFKHGKTRALSTGDHTDYRVDYQEAVAGLRMAPPAPAVNNERSA